MGFIDNINIPKTYPNEFIPYSNGTKDTFNFSFVGGNGNKVITPFPKSLNENIGRDSAMLELKFDFNELMKNLPKVTIREYTMDSKITQIMNAFTAFKRGVADYEEFKRAGFTSGELSTAIKYFIQEFPNKFGEEITGNGLDRSKMKMGQENNDFTIRGINIPFIMYYQLMTAITTDFYTLPYNGNTIDESNGNDGFAGENHGFKTSSESIVGKLLNFIGENIKFHTTPHWKGSTENRFSSFSVSIHLFNDTVKGTANNFLFMNRLLAKNKYLQYQIFQHNPAVYDVNIEGYNRFLMCSAKVGCISKGVSRVPSKSILREIDILIRGNKILNGDQFFTNNPSLIRIPDIYELNIEFTPLLPNSINNSIYRLIAADQHNFENQDQSDQLKSSVETLASEAFEEANPDKYHKMNQGQQ